ncbi:MAG: alpha/beta hydrolase [Gammaproteobacteria bacterium HGW-Gammaproteobacteria-11]|nr:MAG: alpha/beta hydrolase [Gammaproteobacteria bacterium HGW-Gammaproteobacteria-11]
MTSQVDYTAPDPGQGLLRGVLRFFMKWLFRGLIRPAVPIAVQRLVIRLLTAAMPVSRGVSRTREIIAGRYCEWHRPNAGGQGRVMLYLHGGAYLIGSPATHRSLCAKLASLTQMDVCVIDYRLAPEHRLPAPREDAVAAYQALLQRGYAPASIIIAGDSAGAHLTLITALELKARQLPLPAALVCFSPVVDFTAEHLHNPIAGDPLLNMSWIEQAADLVCEPGMNRRDPMLSPINADLSGLPPLLIQVAEEELLLNDSLRFAEAARAAGVRVQLEFFPRLWHVFQANTGLLKMADLALQRVANFTALHLPATPAYEVPATPPVAGTPQAE